MLRPPWLEGAIFKCNYRASNSGVSSPIQLTRTKGMEDADH